MNGTTITELETLVQKVKPCCENEIPTPGHPDRAEVCGAWPAEYDEKLEINVCKSCRRWM